MIIFADFNIFSAYFISFEFNSTTKVFIGLCKTEHFSFSFSRNHLYAFWVESDRKREDVSTNLINSI